jgi:hypothetical protein
MSGILLRWHGPGQHTLLTHTHILLLLIAFLLQVKAKVIRSYVDKMITLAKDGSLHARRQVRSSSTPSEKGGNCSAH